jgi:hypothetical protein
LIDAELSDFIRQAIGASHDGHRALWTILRHLDASLTRPQIHIDTGRGDKSVRFERVLPGRKIVANVKLYHDAPCSFLSGTVWSKSTWLRFNGMESYPFTHHTDDKTLTISLTISTLKFLFSTYSRSLSVDSTEVIIELDPEYTANDISQDLMIPVVVSTEPLPFLLAFTLPAALTILLMAGIYLCFWLWLGTSVSWVLYVAILCGSLPVVVALIYAIYTRVLLKVLDFLQKD